MVACLALDFILMLSQLFTISRTTFLESVRQPIYLLLIAIAAGAICFTTSSTGYAMSQSEVGEVSGDNKLLLDVCLATVFLCGVLLAAFIATSAVSREIENKTVLTVVSKPVPRFVLILGKYVGVAAAMTVASLEMIVFLLLAMRHGVMSTTAHEIDMPVLTFGLSAIGIALTVGVWGNFFYGWHFAQTTALLTLPLVVLAYVLVLLISPKWEVQSLAHDFKPQTLLACYCVLLGLLGLTSIAIAASCRLGQVMTIVICCGFFVMGLMSSHLIGRHAYANEPIARLSKAEPERERFASFSNSGDTYILTLRAGPRTELTPGEPIWYGSAPNGSILSHDNFTPYTGPLDSDRMVLNDTPPALIVTDYNKQTLRLTIRNIGGKGVQVESPPKGDDFLFDRPTKVNSVAFAVWGVIPNLQSFWLLDAVAQNQPIPLWHVTLLTLYAAALVAAFLSIAILLFQNRDVG